MPLASQFHPTIRLRNFCSVIKKTFKNLKRINLCTCKQPLIMADERLDSARDNFGKCIYQLQPKTKTLVGKLERILIKLYRQNIIESPPHIYIYMLWVVKLVTVVVGNQKAPFSIATTLKCRGGRYSFPLIYIYVCVCVCVHVWVCVCVWERERETVCMYVCMYVCIINTTNKYDVSFRPYKLF